MQIIARNGLNSALTGALLVLLPGAAAMAQTPGENLAPIPPNRPSVESYSLPPGPGSETENNSVQGPVDPETPAVSPSVEPRRSTPAPGPVERTAPSGSQPSEPASVSAPAPVRMQQPRPVPTDEPVATGTPDTQTEIPAQQPEPAASGLPPADAPAAEDSPLPQPLAEPRQENDSAWLLLLLAGLIVAALGGFLVWRARRTAAKQPVAPPVARPNRVRPPRPAPAAPAPPKIAEPLPPAPSLAVGFLPRSANTTLFNAVLGFELTVQNSTGEALTEIAVSGAMLQAKGGGDRTLDGQGLAPLHELAVLGTGAEERMAAEFRLPLTSIDPISFQSQSLFVPLVRIAIEFTDSSGGRHMQTASFLVGKEHQPPRPKMAPLRLDLGPRSFAPLGHRTLTIG
ncbi:hypothetical protein [Parasphingorhabdus sp.]|uniref:hypothetical protein n=1 Tax=Parasphingorhabdus sp. TaxID=2709688 RepID=UPI003002CA10